MSYTVEEVRAEAAEISDYGGTQAGLMLTAYADLLEWREAGVTDADYREIARLIGSIFFHGSFVAESYNERQLEALLRKTGNFYETEDEQIAALPVDAERVVEGPTADVLGSWCNLLTHAWMYVQEESLHNAWLGIDQVETEMREWQRKLTAAQEPHHG